MWKKDGIESINAWCQFSRIAPILQFQQVYDSILLLWKKVIKQNQFDGDDVFAKFWNFSVKYDFWILGPYEVWI